MDRTPTAGNEQDGRHAMASDSEWKIEHNQRLDESILGVLERGPATAKEIGRALGVCTDRIGYRLSKLARLGMAYHLPGLKCPEGRVLWETPPSGPRGVRLPRRRR